MKIYDGKGLVAGRLAAKIAKDLIMQEEVLVINANDIILTGKPSVHMGDLIKKRSLKNKRNPQHSPKYPRVPYMMFKKIVRGMLPKKSQRGRDALKNLKVYNTVPENIDAGKAESYEPAKKQMRRKSTLQSLCASFGYKE